jgi:DNA topoisomerase-1
VVEATQVIEAVEKAGLVYVSDTMPGILRNPDGEGFRYTWADQRPVVDDVTLERIRTLAVPPAYTQVWICPDENGHLQATGRDARGRKQYRYHPRFRACRDADKFGHMAEFAEVLPAIHERVRRDFARTRLCREKVLAAVVSLLERSLIRVGNEEYAHQNASYGVTTLQNRHVEVVGSRIRFKFVGKSKVFHDVTLQDRRLAHVVKRLQDLPGQELFQYIGTDGNLHKISSQDVNDYLRQAAGRDVTAKDFRTWAATVLALAELAQVPPCRSSPEARRHVSRVLKYVSSQLRNTPAVCRKCSVHPAVTDAFMQGSLAGRLSTEDISNDEALGRAVVQLIQGDFRKGPGFAEPLPPALAA